MALPVIIIMTASYEKLSVTKGYVLHAGENPILILRNSRVRN